jgi:hypothetical protein
MIPRQSATVSQRFGCRAIGGCACLVVAMWSAAVSHGQSQPAFPSTSSASTSAVPGTAPGVGGTASPVGVSSTLTNNALGGTVPNGPASASTGTALGAASSAPQSLPSVPSIEGMRDAGSSPPALGTRIQGNLELPNSSGQYWVEYDIRPYAQSLKNVDRPQQAILDWILRETGTEVWFNEPMGILTADRTTLRVYHNAGMQALVAQVYERFVNGNNNPHVFGLRVLSISNPNWRAKVLPLMVSAPTKTPGAQAWLMTKENAAIFFAQLRQRQDVKEIQAIDLNMVHGQSQTLEQLRSRNYLREYVPNTTTPWPPVTPSYAEIQEGYRLSFSPLLSLDGKSMDVLLKCDIDQVEKLNAVPIDAPTPGVTLQVEVPQFVSWRMNERFRWGTDQVLLLSCGVIAAPTGPVEPTLLTGGAPNILGLNRILPNLAPQRNDALLIIEYKGSASSQLNAPLAVRPNNGPASNGTGPLVPATASGSLGVSRGRY